MGQTQNVIVSLFEVESEGYQALTELKGNPGDDYSYISAAALVKKENGAMRVLDWFDTGANTRDDIAIGGLVGALFGVLGGPVGILLGGSYGALIGSAFDTDDTLKNASMLEKIAGKLDNDDVAIIGLAFEENEALLDEKLGKFKTIVARFDAAAVAAEVEEAQMMEAEMARLARKELRDEKKAARKERRADKKAELSAKWEEFKTKLRKKEKAEDEE